MARPVELPKACFAFATHVSTPVLGEKPRGCCEDTVEMELCWSSDGQNIAVGECVDPQNPYRDSRVTTYDIQKGTLVSRKTYSADFLTHPATIYSSSFCSQSFKLDRAFLAHLQASPAWHKLDQNQRTVVSTFIHGSAANAAIDSSFNVLALIDDTGRLDADCSSSDLAKMKSVTYRIETMKSGAIAVYTGWDEYFIFPDGTIDMIYLWGGWDPNSTYVANYPDKLFAANALTCAQQQAPKLSKDLTYPQRKTLDLVVAALQSHNALTLTSHQP